MSEIVHGAADVQELQWVLHVGYTVCFTSRLLQASRQAVFPQLSVKALLSALHYLCS